MSNPNVRAADKWQLLIEAAQLLQVIHNLCDAVCKMRARSKYLVSLTLDADTNSAVPPAV